MGHWQFVSTEILSEKNVFKGGICQLTFMPVTFLNMTWRPESNKFLYIHLTKARLPQNNPGMQFYFRRWILLYSFFVLFWLSMLSIWFETKENWRENYRLNHRQKNAISIINIIIHDTVFIYAIIVFLAEVWQVFSILLYSLSFFLGWGLEKPMQKICQRKKTLVPDCFSQKRPRHNLSNPNDLVTGAGCIPTTILLNLGATIWRHSG